MINLIKNIMPWVIAIIYLISPYDLIPDYFVGLGWIDDIAVIGLILWWMSKYRNRNKRKGTSNSNSGKRYYSGENNNTQNEQFKYSSESYKDSYVILGIKRGSTQKEIKEAYKKLAAQYHPDKVQHLGREFQELAQKKFVEIQNAYDSLSS